VVATFSSQPRIPGLASHEETYLRWLREALAFVEQRRDQAH
jgi:hypothetical protein